MKVPENFRQRLSVMLPLAGALLLVLIGPAAAESGGGGHGGPGWVMNDTWRIMNFVALATILFFVLKKPLAGALQDRITGIEDQLKDLETRKKEAEKELAEYNEKLSLLDKQAEKIVQDYIEQGKEAGEKIRRQAKVAAEKLEEQARRNIEHEFEKAKDMLHREVLEKSFAKAEEMIRSGIAAEDQERLVDEYLNKVVTS
ncbi:ATP synthase subunit b 1 [Candidatus Desulfarcum epimagneticum]|uniref:ATP synthase subunit b n=1 Tax=uncultured Desulfobacteraceae bacterium TaxID=218296 RepID=A0A484HEB1_9BACT|nr:ATP synthase subunit b 1 [uncultured Desulfobacteraceae bacterium]